MDEPHPGVPTATGPPSRDDGPAGTTPVASPRHTVILIAVLAVVTVSAAAGASRGPSAPASGSHLAQYTTLIAMEWLLVLYVWRGLRAAGTPFSTVIGRRWSSWREAWNVVLAAAVFWLVKSFVLFAVQRGIDAVDLGRSADAERVAAFLLPKTPAEAAVWVALSITAGFCEEVIYRGYLQRQFSAFTHNRLAGTAAVAALFGVSHAYQGVAAVIQITVYGALFGALSQLTRSLRPGILAHAAEDIVSGLSWRG